MSRFPSPGYRIRLHAIIRLLLFLRAEEDAPKRRDFYRAGNTVICDQCGQEYADHVQDPIEPWLTVLCSGERVKL